MINKLSVVIILVVGTLLILASIFQGLALAGALFNERPPLEGYIGGLIPTFFGIAGASLFVRAWRMIEVRPKRGP
jgi:hypothetical protein